MANIANSKRPVVEKSDQNAHEVSNANSKRQEQEIVI